MLRPTACSGLEIDIARSIACFDPRLDASRIARVLGVSPSTVWKVLQRLRQKAWELWPQHIRDVRSLGLGTAIVYSDKPLTDVSSICDLKERGVPLARYLHSYRATLDGVHIYSYFVPRSLTAEFLAKLEKLGRVDYGFTVPVHPGCSIATPSNVDTLPQPGENSIPRLLGSLIYARLDLSPLASMHELADVTPVIQARLGAVNTSYRLNMGKLVKTYMALSRRGMVGRVLLLLLAAASSRPIPLYVAVQRECFNQLYGLIAETWSAPSIFIGKEIAATVMVLPDEYSGEAQKRLQDCIVYSGLITTGFGTTIPIEMYNVYEKEWSLQPQPLERYIRPYLARRQRKPA